MPCRERIEALGGRCPEMVDIGPNPKTLVFKNLGTNQTQGS